DRMEAVDLQCQQWHGVAGLLAGCGTLAISASGRRNHCFRRRPGSGSVLVEAAMRRHVAIPQRLDRRYNTKLARANEFSGGYMQNGSCDIGLIGLAVMGQNLVLNMNDHGYKVAVFNRTVSKVDDFINNEAKGTQVVGTHSMAELAQSLKRPRRVMLMVKAGDTVDHMI